MADADQFSQHAEGVARLLLGDPNRSHSRPTELRWGNAGSLSLRLDKGAFYDHERNSGGGVLWLIERETGSKGRDAVEWMNEHGFTIEGASDSRPIYARPAPVTGRLGPVVAAEAAERPAQPERAAPPPRSRWGFLGPIPDEAELTATHDYLDENGVLHYQVCRFEWAAPDKPKGRAKTFRQRMPNPTRTGAWIWSVKDKVRPLPYRLPDVIEAIANGAAVFVVEGEKKCDALWAMNVPATCNTGGAKKWPTELNEHFRGAKIVILPDNDEPGAAHAALVAQELKDVAKSVRTVKLPGLGEKEDVLEWIARGGTADALYDLTADAPVERDDGFKSRLGLRLWRDLGRGQKQHEWQIRRWMTAGEVCVVAGPSQAGKSFVVIDMIGAILRGEPWMGRFKTKRGLVVYQAGEGALGLLAKRLPAYRQANGLAWEDDLPFAVLDKGIDLGRSDEDCDALIADTLAASRAFDLPVAVTVIDTASAATPGADENSAKEMSVMLKRCQKIAQETGGCVILVAHMNAEGVKVRGWTGITANVDSVIHVSELEGELDGQGSQIRQVELKKSKDGERGLKERFVLAEHTIGHDDDGYPVTSCTVRWYRGGAFDHQPVAPEPEAPALSDQTTLYLDCIRDAVALYPETAPAELNVAAPVVHKDRVGALFTTRLTALNPAHPPTSNAIRQARMRSGRKLLDSGLIGFAEPFVWLVPTESVTPDVTPPVTGAVTPDVTPDEEFDPPEIPLSDEEDDDVFTGD